MQLQPQPHTDLSQLNPVQCLLLALNRPLVTDTPVSELVVNLVQAAYYSATNRDPPETPPNLPFTTDSILSPPAHYVPPPRYVTDLPLPAPDFNSSGSDNSLPPLPPLLPSSNPEDFTMSQQRAYYSDDELSYINDEDFVPLPPPLPPHPPQAPPQHPRRGLRARPSPQPPHSRALPQPPAIFLPPPVTSYTSAPIANYAPAPAAAYTPAPAAAYAPAPAAAYAPALGVAAMPSIQSKLAPRFLGNIEQPIEDFLEEYERLADRYGLTGPQKVEAVIRYVDRSQCHIWQHLPGFLNRD